MLSKDSILIHANVSVVVWASAEIQPYTQMTQIPKCHFRTNGLVGRKGPNHLSSSMPLGPCQTTPPFCPPPCPRPIAVFFVANFSVTFLSDTLSPPP